MGLLVRSGSWCSKVKVGVEFGFKRIRHLLGSSRRGS